MGANNEYRQFYFMCKSLATSPELSSVLPGSYVSRYRKFLKGIVQRGPEFSLTPDEVKESQGTVNIKADLGAVELSRVYPKPLGTVFLLGNMKQFEKFISEVLDAAKEGVNDRVRLAARIIVLYTILVAHLFWAVFVYILLSDVSDLASISYLDCGIESALVRQLALFADVSSVSWATIQEKNPTGADVNYLDSIIRRLLAGPVLMTLQSQEEEK